MAFDPETVLAEVLPASVALVLTASIGLERQVRQKAAGLSTHALVGTGSAVFTLVSAYGFSNVTGPAASLDPSRIAAQIVSGVGFLGAGVIFVNRDVVRGLTTAATIWMAAAVGMACGAGMLVLAVAATSFHFLTVSALAPLSRKLPSTDRKRTLDVHYLDGRGVLREALAVASQMGFEVSILSTRRTDADEIPHVTVRMRFTGRTPLQDLIAQLDEVPGVTSVSLGHLPVEP